MNDWPDFPSRGDVHLWMCSDIRSPQLDEVLSLLNSEERERAEAFRFEGDRRSYLGGVLLKRTVLAHYLSCSFQELSFSESSFGKPFLDRGGEPAIHFNLSRSHEAVVLAVSGESELGVDIEYGLGRVDLNVKRQFAEGEREFIEKASDSVEAFFEIWARKEAYIKGIGRGLSHPLGEFDVTREESVRDWCEHSPSESWRVHSVELPFAGYAAAIAMPLSLSSIELIEVECSQLLPR